MEKIELNRKMRRAWRWLKDGRALPIPFDYGLARINCGLAEEVTA